jgi:hypothetical protein
MSTSATVREIARAKRDAAIQNLHASLRIRSWKRWLKQRSWESFPALQAPCCSRRTARRSTGNGVGSSSTQRLTTNSAGSALPMNSATGSWKGVRRNVPMGLMKRTCFRWWGTHSSQAIAHTSPVRRRPVSSQQSSLLHQLKSAQRSKVVSPPVPSLPGSVFPVLSYIANS